MGVIMRGWQAGVIVSVALTGCAARQGGEQCAPVTGSLAPGVSAESLAGQFRLIMVGTSNGYAGQRVTGTLDLEPHDSAMRAVTMPGGIPVPDASMPLYGRLDAKVEDAGGVRVGDAMSLDPEAPGVVVVQQTGTGGATTVTLRVGSEANRRDRVRFDGGFLAFHVHEITATGFAGSWASGVRGADRVGFFCAQRTEGAPEGR